MDEQTLENMANIFKENWLTLLIIGAILGSMFVITMLIITRKN